MSSSKKIVFGALSAVVAVVAIVILSFGKIERRLVNVHQRSVAKSIAAWEEKHSKISSDGEMIESLRMLEYVQQYYVPGPGYRGTPDGEARLEAARTEAVQKIVGGLERYSGTNFGTNANLWERWTTNR